MFHSIAYNQSQFQWTTPILPLIYDAMHFNWSLISHVFQFISQALSPNDFMFKIPS